MDRFTKIPHGKGNDKRKTERSFKIKLKELNELMMTILL